MLKLDINLLWTVVNVLVLYAVLRKFLFKPIQNVLEQRQKMMEANMAMRQTPRPRPPQHLRPRRTNCAMWTMKPQPAAKPRKAG